MEAVFILYKANIGYLADGKAFQEHFSVRSR
jgi:hypothetical protein